jgi:hypothetical protein
LAFGHGAGSLPLDEPAWIIAVGLVFTHTRCASFVFRWRRQPGLTFRALASAGENLQVTFLV